MTNHELPSFDEAHIEAGIEQARRGSELLGAWVVARIASQLHGGQSSALYSLASCGAVDHDRLVFELMDFYDDLNADMEGKLWAQHLAGWVLEHDDRPPVDSWYEQTDDRAAPEVE